MVDPTSSPAATRWAHHALVVAFARGVGTILDGGIPSPVARRVRPAGSQTAKGYQAFRVRD